MSVINTNVKSLVAQNSLTVNNRSLSKTMEQLSTGRRINSAADDAAGLAIGNKMTAQIRGLNQAVRNANDGISMLQTAEGATNEITNMLQRMRELAVQSRNDTNTDTERSSLNQEFQALQKEITRIGANTQWNGMNIMDASFSAEGVDGKFKFQVGANANQTLDVTIGNFTAIPGLGVAPLADVSLQATVSAATVNPVDARTIDFTGTEPVENQVFMIKLGTGDDAQVVSYTAAAGDGLGEVLAGLDTALEAATGQADGANALDLEVSVVGNTLVLNDTDDDDGGAGDLDIEVTSYNQLANDADTNDAGDAILDVTDNQLTVNMEGISVASGQKFQLTVGNQTFEYEAAGGDTINEVAAGLAAAIDGATGYTDPLISNSAGPTLTIQMGTDPTAAFEMADADATAITTANVFLTTGSTDQGSAGAAIDTITGAQQAIDSIDTAIAFVDSQRSDMGAMINRLTYAADNLANIATNTAASRSRIMDTDYASATTELARSQIIQQAATAMLAQANQQPQTVLSLLK